jgi:hypothetical protein
MGTAELSFGSAPGADRASVDVTGQTGLTSATGRASAWLMRRSTATHSADEHEMAAHGIKLLCEVPTDGTLRISASSSIGRVTGSFSVEWSWTN